jgi:Fe-S-cluster containining protein
MDGRKPSGRWPQVTVDALEALYAELPAMQCQGLCSDSCFSLVQTPLERDYVANRTGVQLQLVQTPPTACKALGMLGTCTVYEVRPLICRLWGMTAGMRCQYGCQPEGGFLSAQQVYEYLARAAELAGDPALAEEMREPFRRDPDQAERMMRKFQRERDLDYEDRIRAAGASAMFITRAGQLTRDRPSSGH